MNKSPEHVEYVRRTLLPIYNDPQTGYVGRDKLFHLVKGMALRRAISRRDIAFFLSNIESRQLHLVRPRQSNVRPILAKSINERWEVDLIDMQRLSHSNEGMRYLLTVIDVYSKYLWVFPLKNKTNSAVIESLRPLLQQYKPRIVQSDNGPEFSGIAAASGSSKHILTPTYTPQVNGIIERVNGTLKRMIFQYMTNNSTRTYISNLARLVANYNNSLHSKSKSTPASVFLGAVRYEMKSTVRVKKMPLPLMKRGDKCRISMALNPAWKKNMFVKRYYLPRWTKELYTIQSVSRGSEGKPTTYSLQEVKGKRFQAQDLQFVNEALMMRVQRPVFDKPAKQTEDERREAPDIRPNRVPRSVVVGPNTAVGSSGRARRFNAGVNTAFRDDFMQL